MCDPGSDAVASRWSPAVQRRLHDRIVASADGQGEATWTRLSTHLDRLADEWTDAYLEACDAGRRRGAWARSQYNAALDCLTLREAEFAAVVEVVDEGARVADGLDLGYAIGRPSACLEPTGLGFRLPEEPWQAERVVALLRELFVVRALHRIGDHAAARASLAELRPRIDVAGNLALSLRTVDVATLGARTREAKAQARRELERAYYRALGLGEDPLAFRFARRLAQHHARTARLDVAQGWIRSARALADRAKIGDAQRARLEVSAAELLTEQSRFTEALAALESALEHCEAAWGPNHPQSTPVMTGFGIVHRRLGNLDAALSWTRRDATVSADAYGRVSLSHANALNNLAGSLALAGFHDEARSAATEAIDIRQALLPPGNEAIAAAYANLGHVELDRNAALAAFRRVRELRAHDPPDGRPRLVNDLNIATILLNLGRLDEAEAELERSIPLIEAGLGSDNAMLGRAFDMQATLSRLRRDPAGMRIPLLRAREILEAIHGAGSPKLLALRWEEAWLRYLEGDPQGAWLDAQSVREEYRRWRGEPHYGVIRLQAAIAATLGQRERAETLYAQYAQVDDALPADEARVSLERAANLVALGREQQAREVLRDALAEVAQSTKDAQQLRVALTDLTLTEP